MKKIIALLLCLGIFAAAAAGCGGPQITATGDEATNKSADAYKDTYDDLLTYLSAWGYINPLEKNKGVTYTEMRADLIGAKQGRRFNAQHAKDVTIELYEFDLSKQNATADEVMTSVKTNGSFKNLFGDSVDGVYLSGKGKYMMVYNDASIKDDTKETDENYTKRQDVIEKFEAFHN